MRTRGGTARRGLPATHDGGGGSVVVVGCVVVPAGSGAGRCLKMIIFNEH